MQGKQAKIVSPTQERAILGYLVTTRYPARDRVMFLLSMKAGLRAKEMASLTWAMVTEAARREAGGLHGPVQPALQGGVGTLKGGRPKMARPEGSILFSEPGGGLSAATVRLWF